MEHLTAGSSMVQGETSLAPKVAGAIDLKKIAEGCGYPSIETATDYRELDNALNEAKNTGVLSFIEVKAAIGARDNLGRPTITARENRV